MQSRSTPYGTVRIGPVEALYDWLARHMSQHVSNRICPPSVALTGGSTPMGFYRWMATRMMSFAPVAKQIIWTVSDERLVPLDSPESNFGNARRSLLDPMGVPDDSMLAWDTERSPDDAAEWYSHLWAYSFGERKSYDLCLLGMGPDCHVASLFPGSSLLEDLQDSSRGFAAVEVPDKGWRLTITPEGLRRSESIVIMVTGASKAEALGRVFGGGDESVANCPARLMGLFPEKVTWLVDHDAGAGIPA